MKLLSEYLQHFGLAASEMKIKGLAKLVFSQTKNHFSGQVVDEYSPKIVGLSLRDSEDKEVLDILKGSDMFRQVADAIGSTISLPIHTVLVETGSHPPVRKEVFSISVQTLSALWTAEEQMLDALMSDDESAINEASWTKFVNSDTYQQSPCDKETFLSLDAELFSSRYLRAMSFVQYYAWFRRSELLLSEDGTPSPEAAAKAAIMLETGKDMPEDMLRQSLFRNLGVHPRHRPIFESVLQADKISRDDERNGPDFGFPFK